MAVYKLTIKGKSRTTEISTTAMLKAAGGAFLRMSGTTATLGYRNLYREAADELTEESYVRTINRRAPDSFGNYYINGSMCNSWKPKFSSWNTCEYVGGLSLWDFCPACSNCNAYYSIKQWFERVKVSYAALKDATLYNDGILRQHNAEMEADRIRKQIGCDYNEAKGSVVKSTDMSHNYVTTVHMWNYYVSRLNCVVKITQSTGAPEAFVIQLQKTICNCINNARLSFDVDISPYGVCDGDPVSLYVPPVALDFKPGTCGNDTEPSYNLESVTGSTKRIHVEFGEIIKPGTYGCTIRCIPFRAYTVSRVVDGSKKVDLIKLGKKSITVKLTAVKTKKQISFVESRTVEEDEPPQPSDTLYIKPVESASTTREEYDDQMVHIPRKPSEGTMMWAVCTVCTTEDGTKTDNYYKELPQPADADVAAMEAYLDNNYKVIHA